MAKTRDENPSERLQELIAERQRYEAWLAALAARRDAAPAHVIARVEEDYRARLAKIGEELGARAGELRDRITALTDRLAEIRLHEQARRDERAEAELRTAVGELSPGQWSEISERTEREISGFEADRQVVERELGGLESVLAHVSGAAAAPPAVSVQADATRTSAPATASAPSGAAPGGSGMQPAQPAATRPPSRPAPVPHRVPQPSPAQSAAGGAAGAGAPQAPAAGQAPPAAARAPAARPSAPPPGSQKRTDASEREGQEKTLLCAECGTANYPTEWYCEACGAELSNL